MDGRHLYEAGVGRTAGAGVDEVMAPQPGASRHPGGGDSPAARREQELQGIALGRVHEVDRDGLLRVRDDVSAGVEERFTEEQIEAALRDPALSGSAQIDSCTFRQADDRVAHRHCPPVGDDRGGARHWTRRSRPGVAVARPSERGQHQRGQQAVAGFGHRERVAQSGHELGGGVLEDPSCIEVRQWGGAEAREERLEPQHFGLDPVAAHTQDAEFRAKRPETPLRHGNPRGRYGDRAAVRGRRGGGGRSDHQLIRVAPRARKLRCGNTSTRWLELTAEDPAVP